MSEANYGIALMNDCKYGYATHGKTQRLSLLRSPKGPDEHADMGKCIY
jgi:alpha-mannosidase